MFFVWGNAPETLKIFINKILWEFSDDFGKAYPAKTLIYNKILSVYTK